MSILRTLADRDDRRPVVAFVASRSWDDVTFREELELHAERESVTIVLVGAALVFAAIQG
jgi:ferredoxin-NADP reductase